VIEEVNRLPQERLPDLYTLIHYFRLGLEQSDKSNQPSAAKIMALAGSWQEMPESEFAELLQEIGQRRQLAFQRRRNDEAGLLPAPPLPMGWY
jgi:hypothetical protein